MFVAGTFLTAFCFVGLADRDAGEERQDTQKSNDAEEVENDDRIAVETWLLKVSKGHEVAAPPKIVPVRGAVDQLFAQQRFYAVRYLRYPRAVKPPDKLSLENLVRVDESGAVERIENIEALKNLFEPKLKAVKSDDEARGVLRALLRLAEEFYQDGEYTFAIPADAISVVHEGGSLQVSGKSVVKKGGRGEITATITIGGQSNIEIHGKVRPDVRLR